MLEDHQLVVAPGITSLYLNGNTFVYTGTHTWTSADSTFRPKRNYDNGVSVDVTGPADNWSLDFAAPNNAPLTVGTYTGAARFPFQSVNQAGFDVTGDGRGSNTVTGQFTVVQANYAADGSVQNFSANFEHHSDGLPAALFGTIDYQYIPAGYKSGILANDTDAETDPLTAKLVNGPAHGQLTLNSDGTLTYTPANNFGGTDTFTYVANDGTSDSSPATVTITVMPVSDPPSLAYSR